MPAVGADGAGVVVLGEHGRGDADADATVEEVVGGSSEAGGPGDWNREVADRRPAAPREDDLLVALRAAAAAIADLDQPIPYDHVTAPIPDDDWAI